MQVIKVDQVNNKNYSHLFLRTMDAMREAKCPGKFLLQEGTIEIKPWSDKVLKLITSSLDKLGIKYKEENE